MLMLEDLRTGNPYQLPLAAVSAGHKICLNGKKQPFAFVLVLVNFEGRIRHERRNRRVSIMAGGVLAAKDTQYPRR